jgi:hypothetical protein
MERGQFLDAPPMMKETMILQKNINLPIIKVVECDDDQLPSPKMELLLILP